MTKDEEYESLRTLYLKNRNNRLGVFARAFELFGFKDHWMVKDHLGKLSESDMMGDFLIALDVTFRTAEEDYFKEFNYNFCKEIRFDIEMNRGLHYSVKNKLRKGEKDKSVKGLDKYDMKYFKAIYGLSNIRYKPTSTMHEQELEMMSNTVRDFLVSNYGESVYQDCISHYVYGDSFEDLAYYDNNGITRQGMHWKLSRAWKAMKEYLDA